MSMPATRTERDSLGEVPVPADAYYGVHTVRAVDNFAVTGSTIGQFPELVAALQRRFDALAEETAAWAAAGVEAQFDSVVDRSLPEHPLPYPDLI